MPVTNIEQTVAERLEREVAELTEKIDQAQEQADARQDAVHAALEAASRTVASAITAASVAAEIPDYEGPLKAAIRAAKEAVSQTAALAKMQKRVLDIQSADERQRRIEQATRLAADRAAGRRPSGRTAAIRILLDAGRPLHYREITRQALESGLLTPKADAKTPEATMNAMLAVAAKKGETFEKVAPGVFGLIDADDAREALNAPATRTDDGLPPEAVEAPLPDDETPAEVPAVTEKQREALEAIERGEASGIPHVTIRNLRGKALVTDGDEIALTNLGRHALGAVTA